jgi:hypothetical protein
MKRLTITIDEELEQAMSEAPKRLGLGRSASASERLRALARRGYEAELERERDEERLATYRRWADDPEMGELPRAALRRAVEQGLFRDD